MATWTNISNASVAVGGIPSSTTVTALRDNPSAIAESATGAPVVFAGWHPVDKVSVGDGKTGLLYDSAINGTVVNVITPNFQDGYEYRIIAHDLSSTDSNVVRLNLDGYLETSAIYRRLAYTPDAGGLNSFGYDLTLNTPRIPTNTHIAFGPTYCESTISSSAFDGTSFFGTVQKLLRVRVTFTSGSISVGKVWMFRRREYASLP